MPQFYIPNQALADSPVRLTGEEAHHAKDVMRYKIGDEIQLFDGQGAGYAGRIKAWCPDGMIIDPITRVCRENDESLKGVTLAQSLLPRNSMDWLIEKATELGVGTIRLIATERSLGGGAAAKIQSISHWRRKILSSCKQCGRLDLPNLKEPCSIDEVAGRLSAYTRVWMAETRFDSKDFASCIKGTKIGQEVMVIVGPEGGFSKDEYERLKESGAIPVSLGRNILRSETAGLYCLSVLKYLLNQ